MKKKTHQHLRPTTTRISGRGEVPTRVQYLPRKFELPVAGDRVTTEGREGLFWARRLREGSVEEYDPAPKKGKPRKSEETT